MAAFMDGIGPYIEYMGTYMVLYGGHIWIYENRETAWDTGE